MHARLQPLPLRETAYRTAACGMLPLFVVDFTREEGTGCDIDPTILDSKAGRVLVVSGLVYSCYYILRK